MKSRYCRTHSLSLSLRPVNSRTALDGLMSVPLIFCLCHGWECALQRTCKKWITEMVETKKKEDQQMRKKIQE